MKPSPIVTIGPVTHLIVDMWHRKAIVLYAHDGTAPLDLWRRARKLYPHLDGISSEYLAVFQNTQIIKGYPQ